jgi:predicted amidophosphoribosyltransferase
VDNPLQMRKPLRYTMACSGCGQDIEVCPDELDQRLAVCPHCKQPNRTPIYGLLSGRRKATWDDDQ